MSLERARKAINLQQTDKIAQWENINNPVFLDCLTGLDSLKNPREALIETCAKLDLDFIFPLPEKESTIFSDPGKNISVNNTEDYEEVYNFDHHNIPQCDLKIDLQIDPWLSLNERSEHFQKYWKSSQDAVGNCAMIPLPNWNTLFHGFSTTFGYEATILAAYSEPEKFKEVIEKFAILSIRLMEAYSQTDAEMILCHDDLAMVDRTIFSPDWYREFIFPWYKEIWKPVKKAGKKIMFYSDGNIDEIFEDIVKTGVDGIFIDACASLSNAIEKVGGKLFIKGNIDSAKISYGKNGVIEAEIKRCVELGKNVPGYIIACSGGFLNDVPLENAKTYFELMKIFR